MSAYRGARIIVPDLITKSSDRIACNAPSRERACSPSDSWPGSRADAFFPPLLLSGRARPGPPAGRTYTRALGSLICRLVAARPARAPSLALSRFHGLSFSRSAETRTTHSLRIHGTYCRVLRVRFHSIFPSPTAGAISRPGATRGFISRLLLDYLKVYLAARSFNSFSPSLTTLATPFTSKSSSVPGLDIVRKGGK